MAHLRELRWCGCDACIEGSLDCSEAVRAAGTSAERGGGRGNVGKRGGVACVEDPSDVELLSAHELLQREHGGEVLGRVGKEQEACGGVDGEVCL